MCVVRVAPDRACLRKIEPALLCLYGFERAGDESDRESSKEEDREEVENLVISRYGKFNKAAEVEVRGDLDAIGPLQLGYNEKSIRITAYLIILRRPVGLLIKELA
jgi:hypothetical protein